MLKKKFLIVTLAVALGVSVVSLANSNSSDNNESEFIRDRVELNHSNDFIQDAEDKFDYFYLSDDNFNMTASIELPRYLFSPMMNVNSAQGDTLEKVVTTEFCPSTDNVTILITISDNYTLLKEKNLNATLINLEDGEFDAHIYVGDNVILLSELLSGEREDVFLTIIIGGITAAAIAAAAAAAVAAAKKAAVAFLIGAAIGAIAADVINSEWGDGHARENDGVTELDWSRSKTQDLVRLKFSGREANRFFKATDYSKHGPRWINAIPFNQDTMATNKRNFGWSSVTANRNDAENVSIQAFLNRTEFPTVHRIALHTHGLRHFQPVNQFQTPIILWISANEYRTPHSWFLV